MGLYSVNVTSHYEINYLNGPSKMGTLPDSQCRYIIATITGQTGESQVRGERQTLIWCLIMDVKEVHSTGSSCIPSIEILLEVCVLPSNIQKNYLVWTGTSLIILLQICNMKQMNCSAFWIVYALQFIFISLWNTS